MKASSCGLLAVNMSTDTVDSVDAVGRSADAVDAIELDIEFRSVVVRARGCKGYFVLVAPPHVNANRIRGCKNP